MCGGTPSFTNARDAERGLSPRVRGNLPSVSEGQIALGSIPACAGEPFAETLPAATAEVYPRVCGGTVRGACTNAACTGLSPRVRGNR